jgi:hypothetical protein
VVFPLPLALATIASFRTVIARRYSASHAERHDVQRHVCLPQRSQRHTVIESFNGPGVPLSSNGRSDVSSTCSHR